MIFTKSVRLLLVNSIVQTVPRFLSAFFFFSIHLANILFVCSEPGGFGCGCGTSKGLLLLLLLSTPLGGPWGMAGNDREGVGNK